VEGCGGLNTGLVNAFPQNDADHFVDIDCREIIGSWDPNDKQGFPTGALAERFIKKNTDIEYFIRFQNTGTDTAFNIVVIDTLPYGVDAGTIRVGASSHAYTWDLVGNGIVSFRFKNVLLPDSNINEAASHGFVRFTIAQKIDLPNGTEIENEAAIYFDFNPPVFTNQTLHTVGEKFLPTKTKEIKEKTVNLSVYPNPFQSETTISLHNAPQGNKTLQVFRADGVLARSIEFTKQSVVVPRENLGAGVYFFEIKMDGKVLGVGKLVVM
jgi:uncharacterized repeat protein (TIGR01451 family)